ncbi:lysine-specific histone demethylase 1 3 [Tripterygium wilfordii]|uniref:Lysine-specific histone demethylase 1 3 n=1 Tax=Tripterygium wilfordii TaxID=458696 RepID=A0A7J7D3C5_TRIWF|nr:lysine-specific histone demethylase 1 homolog 3 [Tripterygium wilfordii]KAF5740823.1 lysine-specific histone demethylase 1 3 [Tripterygium wilfordii]
MDGEEKKSGSKKRWKQIEIGFDLADDDEPIGALLKLKKPRNPKKVDEGLDGGKGQKAEAMAEKLVARDEDLGCMDDTLASFRKKLKVPKRYSGVRTLNPADDDGVSDVKSASNIANKCEDMGNDRLDVVVDEGVERRRKGKVKRANAGIKTDRSKDGATLDDDSERLELMVDDRKNQGHCHSSDEQFEDPLSSFFQKGQPGLARKSRTNMSLKQNGVSQSIENEFRPSSKDMLGASDTIAAKSPPSDLASDQNGPAMDPCGSNRVSDGGIKQLTHVQVKDSCSAPGQNVSDGLKHCSISKACTLAHNILGMPDTTSTAKEMDNNGSSEGEFFEKLPKFMYDKINKLTYERNLEVPISSCEKFSSHYVKNEAVVRYENIYDCDQQQKASEHIQSHLSNFISNSRKMDKVCSDLDCLDADNERPDNLSVSSQKKSAIVSDSRLSSNAGASDAKETSGYPTYSSATIQKLNQHSDGASEGSLGIDANKESPSSVNPEENESYLDDAVNMPSHKSKEDKLSAVPRVVRRVKKRRHGDMAYEGDAYWEILINEQGFLDDRQVVGRDQSVRMREKFDSSSISIVEADDCGAAAVSAGLKARGAGPLEKIKFKEVLKRKGGLQEYLECRNRILGLWNKDVTRILPLSDCGVSNAPTECEPPRASLIRDVYHFLDQSGYINFGVASEKELADSELLRENNGDKSYRASVADSEDGLSFLVGQAKSSETSLEAKTDTISDDAKQGLEATKDRGFLTSWKLESLGAIKQEESCNNIYQQNSTLDTKQVDESVNLDLTRGEPSCEASDSSVVPVVALEAINDWKSVHSSSYDHSGGNHNFECDLAVRKKIIVVGAGPAGLTAARHLLRQGFSVTVLEGRSRIGGRVYTDRSSFSVPVDLGASIITGVEPDMDTERRPDPSSLVCSQLGLELSVLNSDCPLYDISTGHKVPADLDEALEAEYNSLLDDMLLLVAQRGENAMKMSLEDGLEYALRRRRKARFRAIIGKAESQNSVDDLPDPKSCSADETEKKTMKEEFLSSLERRVMDWHFANLEYGCAALLKEVSLPYWNQDDVYGGFGGAHCMIKGGYSAVVESLGEGLCVLLNHVVTDVSYATEDTGLGDNQCKKVKVSTSNGGEFLGDAVLITVPLGCLKAETIKFSPPLPQWKYSSIERLGFGVLNKVALEFPEVFWDDSVDYFGATAEETDRRGHCFMFWNVKKTVGAPVLIALVVGKAAIDGQNMTPSYHVDHALKVLRKLFGEALVPDPVASVVTNWGEDPFSYGAYSFVAIGATGEDYDILGRPVENCIFFAGEATCKEHPDTVGGAMMSGLREAVRIIDILHTGKDHMAEIEAMEAAERHSDSESDEVRDIMKRLEAVELSENLFKNSLDWAQILTREALLQEMFFNAKTAAGRLHLAKELLSLPSETLKSFAGTKDGLSTLNSWMLDSMGKDGTQLLRHCVRLLVHVSTDLLAVRSSGIGKTVKEKVCIHTSRDIRAIASQLVNVWLEVFRKEKASNGGLKLMRQSSTLDSLKKKNLNNPAQGKPPIRMHHSASENRGSLRVPSSGWMHFPSNESKKKVNGKSVKLEMKSGSKLETSLAGFQPSLGPHSQVEENSHAISEEEKAVFAAAEAARAAAEAAAKALASSEAKCKMSLQLPKIPSFHKFARREQYSQMDEYDLRKKWSGGVLGRQDCLSEIDSRSSRVRDWSVFSATCVNLENSRISGDNLSQRSHSTEIASHLNLREQSGESTAVDSSLFTGAWVDTAGSAGIKDHHAIERWQSQATASCSDFFHPIAHIKDEEDSNTSSRPSTRKHDQRANESSMSQVTVNKETLKNQLRGADGIKHAVVEYVGSLLSPLYQARKIDKDGYKSIMKKTATKVVEVATDAEKAMAISEFLDFKRKNKIRAFVDKLIEKHMAMRPAAKP